MWPLEAIVLVCIGLLPMVIGVREIRRLWRLNYSGVRCTGIVIDLEQRFNFNGGSGLTFAPVVEFVDDQGQPQRFTSQLASAPSMYAVGDEVPVVYLPGRPDGARVNSAHHILSTLVVIFLVGAVFIAIGLSERHSADIP